MTRHRSDVAEIFFSVLIPLLVAIGIMVVICCAPSIDAVIWGR